MDPNEFVKNWKAPTLPDEASTPFAAHQALLKKAAGATSVSTIPGDMAIALRLDDAESQRENLCDEKGVTKADDFDLFTERTQLEFLVGQPSTSSMDVALAEFSRRFDDDQALIASRRDVALPLASNAVHKTADDAPLEKRAEPRVQKTLEIAARMGATKDQIAEIAQTWAQTVKTMVVNVEDDEVEELT